MSMRIRVMGAIFHAPSTAEEISEVTGDDRRRIISNMGPLLSDGLVKRTTGIDQSIEYILTASGKEYFLRNTKSAEEPRQTDAGEDEKIERASIDPTDQDFSAPEADEPINDPVLVDGSMYAIFGASMPNPELAGPTLSDAQQQAISLAYDCGADLQLYRPVPVGRTTTTVVFVES